MFWLLQAPISTTAAVAIELLGGWGTKNGVEKKTTTLGDFYSVLNVRSSFFFLSHKYRASGVLSVSTPMYTLGIRLC